MFTISLSVFIYNHELFVFLPLSSCSGLQSVKGRGRIPAHVAQGTDVHRHVTTLRAPAPRSVERGRKRESDGRRACRLLRTRPWVVSPSLNHITDISRYTVRIDVLQMFLGRLLLLLFLCYVSHCIFFSSSVCSTTLWVGQLDKRTQQQDVACLLEEFGQIESINVRLFHEVIQGREREIWATTKYSASSAAGGSI